MANIIYPVLAGIIVAAGNVSAAGFRLSGQDAKATGMGNSFVAVADNASAAWYNPAAATELEGTNLSFGSVMVSPTMRHGYAGGADSIKKTLYVPPYLYATHKLADKLALSFGFNTPFGLSTEWDKTTAVTRFIATLSVLKVFNYNLSGAYKLTDKLSLGLGVDYVAAEATLNKMIGAASELELTGTGDGWGYNAAAFYRHNEKWTFGANYRSPVKIVVDGTAKVAAFGLSNSASTKLRLPDTFQAGASYRMNGDWLFSANADYTDWATYRKLVVKSATIETLTGSDTSTDVKCWKSVWAFHAGAEYKYSSAWKFRAGAFYDFNPVKERYFETRVPNSDSVAVSVGAGYAKGSMVADISYTYLRFAERTVDSPTDVLDGKYKATAQLPAISIGYRF